MKKTNYLYFLASVAITFISCSNDSASDDFNNVNGDVKEKLVESVSVRSTEYPEDNMNFTLLYNTNGSLSTIREGDHSTVFVYENDQLANIAGPGDNLTIEDLYESPYDAFETGEVLEYDENRNPKKILFYQEEYDYAIQDYVMNEYTAEVTYDDTHNPYFYTLEAAGIISVLDRVQLNFSMNPQAPEIVQARMLFPVNNPSQIVYKNEIGQTIHTLIVTYTYDADNYPTSATAVSTSLEEDDSEQFTYTSTFEYKEN